jgi:farnesyl diphosphate synthase
VAALRGYGEEIGLAFQIADDLLDASSSSAELGKTAGKDARQHKATFATVLGAGAAGAEAGRRVACAVDHLRRARVDSLLLVDFAHFMVERRS